MALSFNTNPFKNLMTGVKPGLGYEIAPTPSTKTLTGTSPMDKLDTELKKIEEKYQLYGKNGYDLPSALDLKEMQYKGMDSDQINEYAKAKLAAEYTAALNALNDDAQRGKSTLESYKEKLNAAAGETLSAIDSVYKEAAAATSDNALKRGLARSSIIVNKLSDLENQKSESKTGVSSKLLKDLADIDNQIDVLEDKRLRAVDELDITNAARLQQEIRDLTEQREKQLDEILKYNNSLREKQADYKLQYAKTDSSLDNDAYDRLADSLKNDLGAKLQTEIAREKFEMISDFLNGLNKTDALNYLKNNESYFTQQVGLDKYRRLKSDQEAR